MLERMIGVKNNAKNCIFGESFGLYITLPIAKSLDFLLHMFAAGINGYSIFAFSSVAG